MGKKGRMKEREIYPVITLYQPWASWVVWGWKPIETREHYRFNCLQHRRILIHAGLTTDKADCAVNNPYLTAEQNAMRDNMPNGFILGSAYVKDTKILYAEDSKEALIDCSNTQRYGLLLTDIKPLDAPIKESGSMGIWYYDLANKQKVLKKDI